MLLEATAEALDDEQILPNTGDSISRPVSESPCAVTGSK